MKKLSNYMGRLGNNLFQFAYLYAKVREGVIPDLYVQDPKYFEQYAGEIRHILNDGIGFIEFVSIHVRRGDYVGNPFYVDLLETDYYQKAIALFPDDKFLVFSDDPEFCKIHELFSDTKRFQVMERVDEVEDLNLMASCKHNIIANSSYSWWAAFLNPNWNKKVVAPKTWFSDGVERTKLPESWIQL